MELGTEFADFSKNTFSANTTNNQQMRGYFVVIAT